MDDRSLRGTVAGLWASAAAFTVIAVASLVGDGTGLFGVHWLASPVIAWVALLALAVMLTTLIGRPTRQGFGAPEKRRG